MNKLERSKFEKIWGSLVILHALINGDIEERHLETLNQNIDRIYDLVNNTNIAHYKSEIRQDDTN